MPNPNIKGTHFKGPLLSADNAGGGFYKDMPLSVVERSRSPYKIFYENFETQLAGGTKGANLGLSGCTITEKGTATAAQASISGVLNYLDLYAGSAVDTGQEFQFILAPNALTTISPDLHLLGPITTTGTYMDGKELFWEARVGIQCDTSADWTGSFLAGWCVTDTDLIEETTGALQIAAGGGFGFYASGDVPTGELGFFSSAGAISAGSLTNVQGINVVTDVAAAGVGVIKWYKLGARMRILDASASTGVVDFYVNDKKVGTLNDQCCMDANAEVFSLTFASINGPGTDDMHVIVDYIMSGITRDGLTYPYENAGF
jgi:hypothetical protein